MMSSLESLKKWVSDMALLIDKNEDPAPQHYAYFIQEPELALRLVELIDALDELTIDDDRAYYSACIFALDICVAQLQAAAESGNKLAGKTLQQLMSCLATAIESARHTLSFWLPILNAFYEVHVDLSEALKNAYLFLASEEDELTPEEEITHLNSIRELIAELSDLSIFDIAENFFLRKVTPCPLIFLLIWSWICTVLRKAKRLLY